VCSFIGGIVSQEVLKYIGKFSPIYQWFWIDFFDNVTLPDISDTSDDRYCNQICMFGKDIQNRLEEMSVFLVGAGALGCEFLKLFSLMGLSIKSELTVTDDDLIETSNLNRQFLFRKDDIGLSKSTVAVNKVKKLNPDINYNDRTIKVGKESEDTLTDEFWKKQDIIFTAVDNIETRKYVDKKIVQFLKVMIDTGTLGTKAHSQIIIPNITSCYNDMQDFASNMAICTLHNFPSLIEHCIEWARDEFTGYFYNTIKELKSLSENFNHHYQIYSNNISKEQLSLKLKNYINLTTIAISKDFDKCIEYAVTTFNENFDFKIRKLLITYPNDYMNKDGSSFWSNSRGSPNTVHLDLLDSMHLLYIASFAYILAKALSIEAVEDYNYVKETAEKFKKKEEESFQKTDDRESSQMKDYLSAILREKNKKLIINEIRFEKEDDKNHHIDFVRAAANVRAQNYKIKQVIFLI
jgi:ubiquitin-activating enzyme E1